ncbi:MAG: hypothetical protein JNK11_17185 [Alphaproteobacteria bacterium]|nr:hypothetical protein [Alphaproteobacteria bacterium]
MGAAAATGLRVRQGDHVLVVRPGALGDAVLTLPLLQALRDRGASRVTIAGTPASWRFLAPSAASARPGGCALDIVDGGSSDWLGLFGGRFGDRARAALAAADAAIVCLRRAVGALDAVRAAGIDRAIGIAVPEGGPRRADGAAPDHVAATLLAGLADPPGLAGLTDWLAWLAPSADEKARALARLRALPGHSGGRLVLLHPGSGGPWKNWPADGLLAVAAQARAGGWSPVFLQGPADEAAIRSLRTGAGGELPWPVLADLDLRAAAAVMAQAAAFVGNDSGATQLAARLCPTVALFGPTDPRLWRPLGPAVRVVAAPEGDLARLGPEPAIDALAQLAGVPAGARSP